MLYADNDWLGNENLHSAVSVVCTVWTHLCFSRGCCDAQSYSFSEQLLQ